ncbi:MAG: hybrid sensor histidine kinase/response regulator [Azospirillum brasilense]|nr:MAG: hybrid sensor histidine kinase/response regulator [Azospirillum brasilense]
MPMSLGFSSSRPTGLSINSFIEFSPIAIIRLAPDGEILEANAAFRRMLEGQLPTDRVVRLIEFIDTEDRPKFTESIDKLMNSRAEVPPLSMTLRLPNGQVLMVYAYLSRMQTDGHEPVLILHLIDQTEQKNLEMRFSHSQKMQAVGQLAGGVAHDFNNLLTAMIGFCDLLLMRHPAGEPSFADIMQIKQNANRAANLVRQLLAFSRRQTLQPKNLDMTDVLAELSNLIRRLIGENIQMKMQHGRDIGLVRADQGQLEQVIINLAVNARDAMKDGGTLTIRTSNVSVSGPESLPRGSIAPTEDEFITAGDYVLVEVEDTGTGIRPEIVKSIFEPFFSTKEVGSGTGLGLSTCYGIIKQSGGFVYVKTEIGVGTSFLIYFKRIADAPVTAAAEAPEPSMPTDLTGRATVLLVEDETPVRIFAARALRNKGYEVLEADSGESALDVFKSHDGMVDMIISDVVMPGMNGPKMITTLYEQYSERMKEVKVIFISGYAEDAFVDTYGEQRSFNFLPKPFTLKQLASKVKEVMDAPLTE